jgi:5-oxoprolinase (ATP-hydrolysing)
MSNRNFKFSIDRGGTFTDIYCSIGNKNTEKQVVLKLLSEDPANYQDAPTEGIRRILEQVSGSDFLLLNSPL